MGLDRLHTDRQVASDLGIRGPSGQPSSDLLLAVGQFEAKTRCHVSVDVSWQAGN